MHKLFFRTVSAACLLFISPLFLSATPAQPEKEQDQEQRQSQQSLTLSQIALSGRLGQMLDICLKNRVMGQDMAEITDIFKVRTESNRWQTEFWGKWMLGAAPLYALTANPELGKMMQSSTQAVVATQSADGYIGNYAPDKHLEQWDVWGRKYTLSGILLQYRRESDKAHRKALLASAVALANHLMSEVGSGPGKKSIVAVGNYRGMAASSVLEPIVWLYRETLDKRYLDFSLYIVKSWEEEGGPGLIAKAVAGVHVADRYPHPKSWFSVENGMKAYEMMSCYQGLLELYKVTGNSTYLAVVEAVAQDIANTEINAAGSGSAFECWYHGIPLQTEPTYHMMETCVTTTWMRLCQSLLLTTGKPLYADWLERTLYNAFLGSMHPGSALFTKYSPMSGTRGAGEDQCGLHTNCCIANGPRGFATIPETLITRAADTLCVNLYVPSVSVVSAPDDKARFAIEQKTDYPATGRVELTIQASKSRPVVLKCRIPSWSGRTSVMVNGAEIGAVKPGSYLAISREWNNGDKIVLQFDMEPRTLQIGRFVAFERGPLLLARDTRFADGPIDESVGAPGNAPVELVPVTEGLPAGIWLGFTTKLVLGTNLEREFGAPREVHFCDFASAGNTWDAHSRYRVWLPVSLNVTRSGYRSYNIP
ncbi:MAG: beta-L-arabinofuranosidase domain-containing protein [Bacteroidales bacterium]